MAFWGSKTHYALIGLPLFLVFASFVIILAGVSAMQNVCGDEANLALLGINNYLAPTTCDRIYSLDWWIIFWQGFLAVYLIVLMAMGKLFKFRYAATALLVTASILLAHQANTWYHAFRQGGAFRSNTYEKRAKLTFSGAVVGAAADLLLIVLIGMWDEKKCARKSTEKEGFASSYVITGAMPQPSEQGAGAAHTETVGYRPGPVLQT